MFQHKPAAVPDLDVFSLELVEKNVTWKTCAGCGHRAEVVEAKDLACSACGRVFAKMDALWRAGKLDLKAR